MISKQFDAVQNVKVLTILCATSCLGSLHNGCNFLKQ